MRRRYRILIAILVVLALVGGVIGLRWLTSPARQLTKAYEGPASFSLRYPEGWIAAIPEMGIMIVADPDTLGGQPGPSLTIQRRSTLMLQGDLVETLEYYLAHGPEVRNRQWTRVTPIETFTLRDGREAARIDLRGREFPQDPEAYVRLVVTRADNLMVYVLGLSAPPESWAQDGPLLMAMLDSLRLAE